MDPGRYRVTIKFLKIIVWRIAKAPLSETMEHKFSGKLLALLGTSGEIALKMTAPVFCVQLTPLDLEPKLNPWDRLCLSP